MSKDVTSEGFVGDGKPTDDRMTIKQIQDNLLNWKGRVKKASPNAWEPIQTLIDRAAELERELNTLHTFLKNGDVKTNQEVIEADTVLMEGKIATVEMHVDLLCKIGDLAISNISKAVMDSRTAGEQLTAEGSALDLIDVVLEFARIGLSSLRK